MAKFSVIVVAAGKAERFGSGEKKTFAKLGGRPVFLRSLEQFITRNDVCQTILAVAPEDIEMVRSKYGPNLGFMGVKLIEGGSERSTTVSLALKAVSDDAEFVAVHDAVRPCVTAALIDAVFAEAVKTSAAILAIPLTGTIKRVGETNIIEETVARSGLYEAQTPQVFKKGVLVDAYTRLEGSSQEITDEARAVELSGHPVSVVISDSSNLKITTKGDVTLANAVVKARPAKPVSRMGAFEEAQW